METTTKELLAELVNCVDQIKYLQENLSPKFKGFTRPTTDKTLESANAAIKKAKGEQ